MKLIGDWSNAYGAKHELICSISCEINQNDFDVLRRKYAIGPFASFARNLLCRTLAGDNEILPTPKIRDDQYMLTLRIDILTRDQLKKISAEAGVTLTAVVRAIFGAAAREVTAQKASSQ